MTGFLIFFGILFVICFVVTVVWILLGGNENYDFACWGIIIFLILTVTVLSTDLYLLGEANKAADQEQTKVQMYMPARR